MVGMCSVACSLFCACACNWPGPEGCTRTSTPRCRSVNLNQLVRRVSCTRRNVLVRDRFCCQYCGGGRNLTLDHVVPVSRGGKDTWTNLVTAW
jgi:5-methylcytosine-specific restriction endonuclease McrA